MVSPGVRDRVAVSVREEVELVTLAWPDSAAGRFAFVVVAPVVAVVVLALLWVAGVLLLAGVGALVGSDVLDSVSSWPKGAQAGLYVGVALVVLVAGWAVSIVAGAVADVRRDRRLFTDR